MKGYSSYDTDLIKVVKPATTTATKNTSDAIDLGPLSNVGVRSETFELELQIPDYDSTELPSNAKLTIGIESSDDADFANAEVVLQNEYGDGTSNPAKFVRYKPTLDSKQYWRAFVTTTLKNSATLAGGCENKAIILAYVC